MKLDSNILDQVAERLSAVVPEGMRHVQKDLESNFRVVLQSALGRLDLVTREEFDAQQAVLSRTRERLEQLSTRLQELEGATSTATPRKRQSRKTTAKK